MLARPRFKFDAARVAEVLAQIEADGLSFHVAEQTNLSLPDPDDEPFLAVALTASADFLVTGNSAHYPRDKRRGCAVLTPAEFMKHWKNLERESGSSSSQL